MFSIADNLQNVRQVIKKAEQAAGRVPGTVLLLPVSKTRSAATLVEAMELGLSCFGENYLSEALAKQDELLATCGPERYDEIEWHFIGPVQSNKTRAIAERFDWVQSLDRLKIARRLNEQRPEQLPPLNVCIQINIDQEDNKSGIHLSDLHEFVAELDTLDKLSVRGLMAIPRANQNEQSLGHAFAQLNEAFEQLKLQHSSVDTLSMGMSSDVELAIKTGSTMVRVGTALFGPRNV